MQGAKSDRLQDALVALDPKLGRWADEFIFGDVWDDDTLDPGDQIMVAVVALAATGRTRQLTNYLHSALQSGVQPDRIRASLRMLVVYCGFPTAIDALVAADTAIAAHERTGGHDA
nr:carboxymuconolactone decarboxylase family protein [Gordonia sp. LAM0048]